MKVNCYDIVVVVDPTLSENAWKDLISNKVKKLISSMGGEVLTEDNWGIKKFAHPIKKHNEGLYYFIKAKLPGNTVKDITYNLKITEGILRISIIKSLLEVAK